MSIDWEDVIKWGIACITATAILTSVSSCMNKDRQAYESTKEKIAEAVKSGVDPILAYCTFNSPQTSQGEANSRCAVAQALNEVRKNEQH